MRLGRAVSALVVVFVAFSTLSGCGSDGQKRATDGSGGEGGVAGEGGSSGEGGVVGCGDGACLEGESCQTCPEDCGACEVPSCKGELTCDDNGTSCCESVRLPGGSFLMGRSTKGKDVCPCNTSCSSSELPEHEATVSSFFLDEFEVTVGRFRQFLAVYSGPPEPGVGENPLVSGSGWKSEWDQYMLPTAYDFEQALHCDDKFGTWTDEIGEHERLPVNCVTWFEAFAFCAWDGGRLPTEAEWEYAAAGAKDNRLYPWGDDVPTNSLAAFDCLYDTKQGCSPEDLPRVGSCPAGMGRWGHRDLAGSVDEWVLDWMGPYGSACDNCANLTPGTGRVLRGGAFSQPIVSLRVTARSSSAPDTRLAHVGFRCARSVPAE